MVAISSRQKIYGPRLYTKAGYLTAYGLACGYQETASKGQVTLKLYHDGGSVYHVRAHDHGELGRLFWETFDTLPEAREFFKKKRRELNLIRR